MIRSVELSDAKSITDIYNYYDVHSIMAKITLPNEKSINLHEFFGFKNVGTLKEVGRKFDKWLDIGYWELIL